MGSKHVSKVINSYKITFCCVIFVTARKRSLRGLCFHRCLSVHRGTSGQMHAGIHTPLSSTPPSRYPPWQVHPLAGTTLGRYTPGRYTPGQTAPLCSACWDTVNKRAVRIPLECILVLLLQWWMQGAEPLPSGQFFLFHDFFRKILNYRVDAPISHISRVGASRY